MTTTAATTTTRRFRPWHRAATGFAVAAVALAAAPAAAASTDGAAGFIHGTLTTRSGSSYTGFLRWDDEEAFWDDMFQSAKQDTGLRARYEQEPGDDQREERWWQLFGKRFRVSWSDTTVSHVFATRFGDIAEIEATGENQATVHMKTGTVYHVEGYANDVSATVHVADPDLGRIEVPWSKIERVRFSPAPAGAEPPAGRLAGTLTSDAGTFDGFVMWDSQECETTDLLDGDTEDGRVSIAMGTIATIERHSRAAARVVLRDGRELLLDGTNDVDDSIRGIFVEDPRFGRIEVAWDEFRRLELRPASGSGRAYADFDGGGMLHGTVTTTDGAVHRGRLVYDLDEAEGWEMLDGTADDVDYAIPFAMVATVEPAGRDGARVTLRGGATLELTDTQDVTDRNDGVLVTSAGGEETYLPWREIRRIELAD